jgi:endonuclease/exonuclease/phosphatase family metal-dependent hydrolase
MGISGYEIFVLSPVAPFFLVIPAVRTLVIQNLRIVHLLSVVGLLAFLTENVVLRLFAVSFGVSATCIAWSGTFYAERNQQGRVESRILGWGIGLIMSSVAKFAFWTNNPIWPIVHATNGGWNITGLILAVLAILRATRWRTDSSVGPLLRKPGRGAGLLNALGFGGLLYGLHGLLSDSSTMISWVWEGYPIRGPMAVPHGAVTIFVMGGGLVFGMFNEDLTRSWTFYGVGCLGAAVLTCYSQWFGYFGGLTLTLYLMAITPTFVASAARTSPGSTFGLGFMFYSLIVLASVWTVAYAFVPFGKELREHNDWVMVATMLSIGAGVFSAASSAPTKSKIKRNPFFGGGQRQRAYYLYVLAALQLVAVTVAFLRFPSYDYKPYHPEEKLVTTGIWTIHFSLDNDMWSSERRMRDVIKELELDVVGLLESDLQRIIMGNRDTTQFLAEDLGMYVDYGPGPNKHTWGAALLSKFPIINSTHHLLPSPVGELAPAIHATLDMYGELVDVFVFHSGQEEDPEDRRQQSLYLSDLMKASPRPSILLSYLVTTPLEGNYNTYVGERSGMRDIDATDWDRWCEYILYKGIRRSGYARVSRSTITDTEIQVGKFIVGQPEGTEERVDESHVPEGQRFPALFRGEGVRGHQYHVFDEPR